MLQLRWVAGLLLTGSGLFGSVAAVEPLDIPPAPLFPQSPVFQRVIAVPVSRAIVPVQSLVPRPLAAVGPMLPLPGTAVPATPLPSIVPPAISSAPPLVIPPYPTFEAQTVPTPLGTGIPSYVPQSIAPPNPSEGFDTSAAPTIQHMPQGHTILSDSINHSEMSMGGFGGGCSSCVESTYTGRYKLFHRIKTKLFRELICGPQYPCGSDGCTSPLGCNNFHSASAFAFGSCRTFFGTQASAPSHCNR